MIWFPPLSEIIAEALASLLGSAITHIARWLAGGWLWIDQEDE